jgi:uncharacterized protein
MRYKTLLLALWCFAVVGFTPFALAQVSPDLPVQTETQSAVNMPTARVQGFQRFVVDKAAVLSDAYRQQLTQTLAQLDRQGQAQVTVVILPSTDQELSELAPVWFNAWGIGHGKRHDGILVLVNQARVSSRQSGNRLFVAVGTGVQGTLPDGRVGQLIRDFARPGLNAGDTEAALQGLMPELVRILSEEPIQPLPDKGMSWFDILIMLVVLLVFFNMLSGRRRGGLLIWPGGLGGFGGGYYGGGGDSWSGGSFGGGGTDGGGSGD